MAEKLTNGSIILDVHGVGYGLLVPAADFNHMPQGDMQKVLIYEHIRENGHDLYGFTDIHSKQLFEQLLDVSGVGPKMALCILSVGSTAQVKGAIANGDVKLLQAASGVGKRVAERVVVDLKDKVGLPNGPADQLLQRASIHIKDDAIQALQALGYTTEDAVVALSSVDKDLPTEERVRQVLKGGGL